MTKDVTSHSHPLTRPAAAALAHTCHAALALPLHAPMPARLWPGTSTTLARVRLYRLTLDTMVRYTAARHPANHTFRRLAATLYIYHVHVYFAVAPSTCNRGNDIFPMNAACSGTAKLHCVLLNPCQRQPFALNSRLNLPYAGATRSPRVSQSNLAFNPCRYRRRPLPTSHLLGLSSSPESALIHM